MEKSNSTKWITEGEYLLFLKLYEEGLGDSTISRARKEEARRQEDEVLSHCS